MTVTAPTLVEASDIVLGYNGRVVLGGAGVATDDAGMADDAVQLESTLIDPLFEVTKVVQGIYTHGYLLDPVRVVHGSPAGD